MCTVVVLRRIGHTFPLVLAANRDEMQNRPSRPPARHWENRFDVVAGLDELAGGTWLGINDNGVVAAILNRRGTLGPAEGFRSRGEIPLEALDHADAQAATDALSHLSPQAYRPFNLVIADNRDAFWLRNTGTSIDASPIPEGVSMITAYDLNDETSPRIGAFLPRFRKAKKPDPVNNDWSDWQSLLANGLHEPGSGVSKDSEAGQLAAMNIKTDIGFGTVSSSLLALPTIDKEGAKPVWLYANGRPGATPYQPVDF